LLVLAWFRSEEHGRPIICAIVDRLSSRVRIHTR
jgi:hypothetical protein